MDVLISKGANERWEQCNYIIIKFYLREMVGLTENPCQPLGAHKYMGGVGKSCFVSQIKNI